VRLSYTFDRRALGRRERPKLLFNARNVPTHLYNGAISKDYGAYTIVAPLQV
jgi:hypothetical protein